MYIAERSMLFIDSKSYAIESHGAPLKQKKSSTTSLAPTTEFTGIQNILKLSTESKSTTEQIAAHKGCTRF